MPSKKPLNPCGQGFFAFLCIKPWALNDGNASSVSAFQYAKLKGNWQRWQCFLVVAEQGRLARAAESLQLSQATLSRQVLALEQELQLVQKDCLICPWCLLAHRQYLATKPEVACLDDLGGLRLIGCDQSTLLLTAAQAQGWPLTRQDFSWRTDSMLLQIQLIERAQGLGINHQALLPCYPNWQPVLPDLLIPALACYLVCHQDLYSKPRMRALMDFLSRWFAHGYHYQR